MVGVGDDGGVPQPQKIMFFDIENMIRLLSENKLTLFLFLDVSEAYFY